MASRWEEIDRDPQRISKLKKFEADFDWSGIGFLVSFRDIEGFEFRNQILINILVIEDRQIYVCWKGGSYEHVINLMLIMENNRKHYVAIKSLSRLLWSQNTKHKEKEYFCTNCLQEFWEECSGNEQVGYCKNNESVRIEMPHRRPIVEYSDGQFQFKVPFIMYADFESILEPIQGPGNDLMISSTRGVNNHIPSGWCVCSEFAYKKIENPLKLYRGKDCIKKFCDHVIGEARHLYHSFPEKPMTPLTPKEMDRYKRSERCHICFKPFKEENPKVRDHCHYTGHYRGPAHMKCNLQYKTPSYIPIMFHNLSGYDTHLFIKGLANCGSKMGRVPGDSACAAHMGVIAKNKEDYISFSIKVEVNKYINKKEIEKSKEIELRFIDSFKFMSSSLDSLVNNLARRNNKFFGFKDYNKSQYKLLIQKGIYPYKYIDDWDKFKETTLPPKEAFYSKLNMSGVSDRDYEHARRVWRKFGVNNLGEYHDLYLRMDVILLANIFESFRKVCLDNYGLDPAHFYTAPGLAWRTCLKKTRIRLELLLDPDMLLMFKRGIRGGITQSVHRWAKANNPYMGSKYAPREPTRYLQYLDANNLYGWAMSQPLPTGGFCWVDVKPDEISKLANFSEKGYLLEVDVQYPRELHNYHNDLPFICECMVINEVEKLIPNLYYKKRYVIHIRALDQALKHGLVLEHIHRVIEFKQSAWMKEYIDFNTKLRTAASNDFEKDFHKLMNNAVFEKSMENIRKHRNIKLIMN